MDAYAVIETGGKQYLVKNGAELKVEKLDAAAGDALTLGTVLAVSNGEALTLGAPEVAGAAVKATLLRHIRGPKVVSFKKKRRKGYARKQGHRQDLSVVRIESVL